MPFHFPERYLRFFRRRQWDEERARELETHIEIETADNIARGMSAGNARAAALRKLGNRTRIREQIYDMNTIAFVETLWQDLRYAARMLAKSPGFTAVAILTLALGIGATTAIFTLLYTVMLRPLPVKDPGRLVLLQWHAHRSPAYDEYSGFGYCEARSDRRANSALGCSFSSPMFDVFHAQARTLSGLLAFGGSGRLKLTGNGPLDITEAEAVTGDYFQVLGVRPALGRLLQPSDDSPGAPPALVLSYAYWQSAFGAARSAIGRTVELNNVPFTILGVADPKFGGLAPGHRSNMWFARSIFPRTGTRDGGWSRIDDPGNAWLAVIGRLKPGTSPAQAQAEVNLLFRNRVLYGSKPLSQPKDDPAVSLIPAQEGLTGSRARYSTLLYVLSFGVGMILLIACANVAGLLLARSAARHKEMAVRLALGARRKRLIRQLLTESVLLSVCGGVAGALAAYWGVHALAGLISGGSSRAFPFSLAPDWRILAFTSAISIFTGILAGFAPAFRSTRVDLTPALKESAERGSGTSRARQWFSAADSMVIAQVALAVVVLAGAGLFVRTIENLESIDAGFDTRNILLVTVQPALLDYTPGRIQNLYRDLQSQFAALPGVRSVSYSGDALLDGNTWSSTFAIEDQPENNAVELDLLAVGPDFFRTMGIRVLAGRRFTAADFTQPAPDGEVGGVHTGPPRAIAGPATLPTVPVIVNQAFARRYFANRSPLGAHLEKGGSESAHGVDPAPRKSRDWEIVGVAADAKYDLLKSAVPPEMYLPAMGENACFELRTAGDPLRTASFVRSIVARADRNLPVDISTQSAAMDEEFTQERLTAQLSSLFALLSLLLACIGLYGLLAYDVARRTREIGIRMALGAQQRNVLRMVFRQGLGVTLAGAAIGCLIAAALTRYAKSLLYGVGPGDPATLLGVALVLVLVAAAACYLPARRAMRVDPMTALRHE